MARIEYVRVRQIGGARHEMSIPKGSSLDGWEVLDRPSAHPSGSPLPPKHRVVLDAAQADQADITPEIEPTGEGATTEADEAEKE